MAVTLADVTEKLSSQNDILVNVNENMSDVSTNLSVFIESLKADRGDDLERDIEAREKDQARDKASRVQVKQGGLLGGLGLGEGLSIGAGIGLLGLLGKALISRGIPFLLVNAFANEIADWMEEQTDSKEFGDAIFRGLKLGSLGMLINKRLALLGFVGGAALTPEVEMALEDLEVNFAHFFERMQNLFGVVLPDVSNVIGYMGDVPLKSIEFLSSTLAGDFDSDEFKNNWDEFAAAIGILALIIAPRGTLMLAIAGVTAAIKTADKAIKGLVFGGAAAASASVISQIRKANVSQIKDLSEAQLKQLSKQGIVRNLQNQLFDTKTGSVLDPEQARSKLGSVGVKNPINVRLAQKSPTFQKLLTAGRRVPYLGAAITAGSLAATLMGNGNSEEKVTDFGRFFGGTAGAVALGSLGTLVGGPLAGIPAGLLGFGFGEAAGEWLAQKILTEAGMMSKSSGPSVDPGDIPVSAGITGGRDMSLALSQSDTTLPRMTTSSPRSGGVENYEFSDLVSAFSANGAQPVIVMDNSDRSVKSSGVTTQAMITPPTSVYDKYDFMNASRIG